MVNKTIIYTSLPYCLYKVDDRFFKLYDPVNSKIRFIKVETTPNRRTSSSKNIEIIRDRWGIDAHSDVKIYTDKIFQDIKKAEVFTLEIVNNFIKRYRYFNSEAVHLVLLSREDLFGLNVMSDSKVIASISLAGGVAVRSPLLIHKISNKIEKSISENQKINFYEELLLNSERYIYQKEYRHAILESVIALELVISDFISKKCSEKGISDSEAEEYIKNIGLTGNIKVTLRLLLGELLPEDEIFNKCKSGITIRNKIVHKGRKEVSTKEAQETLDYNKKLIEFILV